MKTNPDKKDYLNVGCGFKIHPDWHNCDFFAANSDVLAYDLRKGIPFPDDSFSVVYLSQVIEHFEKDAGMQLLTECLRVLKPGGVIRLATPDLELVAHDYLQALQDVKKDPSLANFEKYEWIVLELIDQSVRNRGGGGMAEFLLRPELKSEDWVVKRSGDVARRLRELAQLRLTTPPPPRTGFLSRILRKIKMATPKNIIKKIFLSKEERAWLEIGKFREGGEIHYWLYDEFFLSHILSQVGFINPKRESPFTSRIQDWAQYELDVKNGVPFDPHSLFIEAAKPG